MAVPTSGRLGPPVSTFLFSGHILRVFLPLGRLHSHNTDRTEEPVENRGLGRGGAGAAHWTVRGNRRGCSRRGENANVPTPQQESLWLS